MDKSAMAKWDSEAELWRGVQNTIKSVKRCYDDIYSLNTAVSDLMILTNTLVSAKRADPALRREAASILVRLMAPITPAFAEECWSVLHPSTGSIFKGPRFPTPDEETQAWVAPRKKNCTVQINGKVRGQASIPPAPAGLEGNGLRDWIVDQVLATEEGAKFKEGPWDLRNCKRAIVVQGGKLINFVM
jgi:leucyl-tRNA synthetase